MSLAKPEHPVEAAERELVAALAKAALRKLEAERLAAQRAAHDQFIASQIPVWPS